MAKIFENESDENFLEKASSSEARQILSKEKSEHETSWENILRPTSFDQFPGQDL